VLLKQVQLNWQLLTLEHLLPSYVSNLMLILAAVVVVMLSSKSDHWPVGTSMFSSTLGVVSVSLVAAVVDVVDCSFASSAVYTV
jgi:hypothetical protein